MPEADPLVLDFVEWVAREPRAYSEVIDAWKTSCPRLTIWEDAANSLDPQGSTYRAVFYSGQYRLGQDTLDVNIDQAEHEGWVGAEPFDLTWTEGRTSKQETRSFRVETDAQEREILRIETAPMRNPNGAENTIIGRAIWTRVTDWEFGQPK